MNRNDYTRGYQDGFKDGYQQGRQVQHTDNTSFYVTEEKRAEYPDLHLPLSADVRLILDLTGEAIGYETL